MQATNNEKVAYPCYTLSARFQTELAHKSNCRLPITTAVEIRKFQKWHMQTDLQKDTSQLCVHI